MLMTAGSTSTWPKSGLTERSRVRLLLRPPLRSKPAFAASSWPVRKGLPGSAGLNLPWATGKGEMSGGRARARPPPPVVGPRGRPPKAGPGGVDLFVVGKGAVPDGAERIDAEVIPAP